MDLKIIAVGSGNPVSTLCNFMGFTLKSGPLDLTSIRS